RNAWEKVQLRRQMAEMEKGFSFLIRTLAARIIAEDVGTMLRQTYNSLTNVTRRLQSGDTSLLPDAADAIRTQFTHLLKEFDRLTRMLVEGGDTADIIDVRDTVNRMLGFYQQQLREAGARARLDTTIRVEAKTYASNLKLALHEVIINACDALKSSSH